MSGTGHEVFWKPGAIFDAPCPKCGRTVEFFKDGSTRKCPYCGNKMVNPQMDFGCASYCQHAGRHHKEIIFCGQWQEIGRGNSGGAKRQIND